jgi:hypothetical protein
MTIDDAKEIIERMKAARSQDPCEKCEREPFTASLKEPDGPPGFELATGFACYFKRCEACQTSRLFPWADRLDAEKVAAFVETDPRICGGMVFAWPLALLEETL